MASTSNFLIMAMRAACADASARTSFRAVCAFLLVALAVSLITFKVLRCVSSPSPAALVISSTVLRVSDRRPESFA